MKVATLEKFHLRGGGDQDPGNPGVGKVRGEGFFSFKQGGNWPWMTLWSHTIRSIIIENNAHVVVACQNNVKLPWHAILNCMPYYGVWLAWNWILLKK